VSVDPSWFVTLLPRFLASSLPFFVPKCHSSPHRPLRSHAWSPPCVPTLWQLIVLSGQLCRMHMEGMELVSRK
jgi:hypothetical protein